MSTRFPRVSSTLQGVRDFLTLVYFPFMGWKWWIFEFLLGILRIGEDKELPQEERGLRLGKGKVRLGKGVRLGERVFA